MGHENHGTAMVLIQTKQQVDDKIPGGTIQIARRFIGQKEWRSRSKRSGHGDSLLFPTG